MKSIINLLIFSLLLTLFSHDSQARKRKKKQYFNQMEFTIDFKVTHPILAENFVKDTNQELLIMGENEEHEKILALYIFDQELNNYKLYKKIKLPKATIIFDLFTSTTGLKNVLLLSANGLSILNFDKDKIIPLSKTQSLYLDPKPQFIAKKELVTDINGDGLDDIAIANFTHVTLLIQQNNDEFKTITLPIKSTIDMSNQQITFTEVRLFNVDTNFDQLKDIVIIDNGKLQVFEQLKSGNFNLRKKQIALPMQVSALPWWSIKGADGQSVDQSNLEHRMLETIEDINGDGITDIMVKQTKSNGVLDRQNHYEIYYGLKQSGLLTFNQKPDTVVSADGTLSGLELLDINANGRKEILVSSFDIGVFQIVGALLSGSIDQDVYVFALNENNKYSQDPLFSEDVDLNFSLSSGSSGKPVILLADLNGDGLKELILSAGKKKLAIYQGKNNKKLFKSRPKKHKLKLPKDGSMITTADLNNDNKQEIIVRYGKQDSKKLRNKVVILSIK